MARAFTPWPGAWTMWPDGDVPKRLRIDEAEAGDFGDVISEKRPGFIQTVSGRLLAHTGAGSLEIKKITLEGKRSMDARSFLSGYPSIVGSILI